MSEQTDRAAIRATMQAGYGDATQTVLDDKVAGDILATLRQRGWASLQEVGALILAAGGEIRITGQQMLLGGDLEVTRYDDPSTMETVFRARPARAAAAAARGAEGGGES